MSDKPKVNFVIDAVMFLCMMAMLGIGLLMRFVLIPGKARLLQYGRDVDLYLAGMDRHEWGRIHLIIGCVLLGLLVLHIILHWKMILNMYGRLIGRKRARRIVTAVFISACVSAVVSSFVVGPEVRERARGEGRHAAEHTYLGKGGVAIEVRGHMLLTEVAGRYDIPIEYLKSHLGMATSTSDEDKLAWLGRRYGFRMSEVERTIRDYHASY